MKKLSGMMYHI